MCGLLAQSARVHDGGGNGLIGFAFGGRQIDGNIGLLKRRNLIMIRILGIGFVRGAVDEVQVQAIGAFADDDALLGKSNFRIAGVGNIRHENVFPQGSALRALHILHIQNVFRKSFVENAGLDFKRNLRAFQAIFQADQRGLGAGRNVESVGQGEQPGGDDEDGKYPQEGPHAHAAGAHGGDFRVGCETAEADQNSQQHAHGNGVGKRERHGEKENLSDAGQGSAGADDEFEDVTEVAREQDKGEDGRADQGMGRHFAQDVAGKNPHETR